MNRRGVVGTGILVAAGFFLMQLAWILTMPAATGIDEFDHMHRAASVASGHWGASEISIDRKAGRGWLVPVPTDIVEATKAGCKSFQYVGRANCSSYADAGDGIVMVACAAARYNPLFYAAVGYPSSLFHGDTALTVMRLVSAALSAAMVGLGAIALRSWARTGWPLLALFLATTPTVIYSSSIAAPNGLSIVSGLTLWAALLGLVRGADDVGTRRRLLVISAVAAVTMVNTHTLGLVWLVLILLAVAIQRGTLTLPRVPRAERRQTWLLVAAALVGLAFAAGWVLITRTNSPSGEGTVFHHSWWPLAFQVGVPLWPLQAIAAFPLRDEPAPTAVYAIGIFLMLAVAIKAIISLVHRRDRASLLTIAFVVVASYAVPLVLTAMSFRYIGLAWQGRYEMPFTGGLLLLFALALDQARTRLPTAVAFSAMGLMGLMNVLSQLRITHRFDGGKVADAIGWHAPSPVTLVLLAIGFAVCGGIAVTRGRPSPQDHTPETGSPVISQAPDATKVPVA